MTLYQRHIVRMNYNVRVSDLVALGMRKDKQLTKYRIMTGWWISKQLERLGILSIPSKKCSYLVL